MRNFYRALLGFQIALLAITVSTYNERRKSNEEMSRILSERSYIFEDSDNQLEFSVKTDAATSTPRNAIKLIPFDEGVKITLSEPSGKIKMDPSIDFHYSSETKILIAMERSSGGIDLTCFSTGTVRFPNARWSMFEGGYIPTSTR